MKLPSDPVYLSVQRHSGRFWNTNEMLHVLAMYFGFTCESYPSTWQYRALVAIHRDQHSVSVYRRGYGPDWHAEIRPDLLEYMQNGRLPLAGLVRAAALIRQAELVTWALALRQHAARPTHRSVVLHEAAK